MRVLVMLEEAITAFTVLTVQPRLQLKPKTVNDTVAGTSQNYANEQLSIEEHSIIAREIIMALVPN